jgi:hypothetical protein
MPCYPLHPIKARSPSRCTMGIHPVESQRCHYLTAANSNRRCRNSKKAFDCRQAFASRLMRVRRPRPTAGHSDHASLGAVSACTTPYNEKHCLLSAVLWDPLLPKSGARRQAAVAGRAKIQSQGCRSPLFYYSIPSFRSLAARL